MSKLDSHTTARVLRELNTYRSPVTTRRLVRTVFPNIDYSFGDPKASPEGARQILNWMRESGLVQGHLGASGRILRWSITETGRAQLPPPPPPSLAVGDRIQHRFPGQSGPESGLVRMVLDGVAHLESYPPESPVRTDTICAEGPHVSEMLV